MKSPHGKLRRVPGRNWLALAWLILCLFLFGVSAGYSQETVRVIVEGLEGRELANVTAALTLPPGLVKDGKVDRLWFERFQEQAPQKIRGALEPFGYYDARVSVDLETTEKGEYKIVARVNAGEPVRVTSVRAEIEGPGADEKSLKEILARFPLHQGSVLREDLYEAAKTELQVRAVAAGYLDAQFSTHVIRVSRHTLSAEIELLLQTGPRYLFGEVNFTGKPVYPRKFLLRFLEFKPGDFFTDSKMVDTQLNFARADRFKEITVYADKASAHDLKVPVDVNLVTLPTKRLKSGVGFATDTGPGFSARYQDFNVGGGGHEIDTELKVSERLQGLAGRYILPDSKDLRSFTSLKLALQQEDTTSYQTKSVNLELEKTRSFGPREVGSLFVQFLKEDSTAGDEGTHTFSVIPGIRFSGQHYDNLIRPTKGFHYKLEAKGTHEALGSDSAFLQFQGSGDTLIPLPYRFSLFLRGQAGTTFQSDPFTDIPIAVRFFTGGDNSVRGYAYQSLGPKDGSGNVVGGKNLLVGSIELERAIGKDWGLAAFYDTGNAFNSFLQTDLAQAVGLGVRYYTPVGPVRLDLARQVGIDNPGYRIHFTVGFVL